MEPTETDQEFDEVAFEVTIHENGSATWTFQYERALDNESGEEGDEAKAFSNWADDFESEDSELYSGFQNQAENLTESGAENSGRDATATDFEREAYVDQEGIGNTGNDTGVVEMSFVWNGFAEVENDGTVRAGDVFDEWVLLEDQRFTVGVDDSLAFQSIHEDGEYNGDSLEDAHRVTWSGEMEFIPGEPRIVLENTERSSMTGLSGAFDMFSGDGTSPLLVIALLIAALVGAGALVRYYSTDEPSVELSPEDDGSSAEATGDTATTGAASQGLQEAELLTDEDRVVTLIEENGGRMKQVDIVDETGWSKSKVSMLLSEMEDDGTISKLRVGRENIISLEGHEPEATKSPFDE
ncbi:helix-turn-helix transcriptional regulator [Halostagnicola larsenii]|uniref:helix-turn-helix transcriptional regulator n=1 Tax=Halostagnicola larsenii TaxID=353800 RepID=UPI0006785ECF|nr:MarR family transcriptional regulator [Halostagnicola larsenii]